MHEAWMRLVAPPMAPAPAADPNWLAELQRHAVQLNAIHAGYLEKQSRLWTSMLAGKVDAVAQAQPGDKRFEAKAWTENPYFDYLKQSYLLASRYVEELV